MARKKQFDYFGKLAQLATNAHQAAQIFQAIVEDYSLEKLVREAEQIHELEREGDQLVTEIVNELYVSFITPIDREDIVQITDHLDDILDAINSMSYLLDHLVVEAMTPAAKQLATYIVEATEGVKAATEEFAKFKNSKTLVTKIDAVNQIESEADRLYSQSIKALMLEENDVLHVIKWKDVYDQFEETINDCEQAVNIIVGIVIKNS